MAKIIIPTPLRKFTEDERIFECNSDTVIKAISELILKYPGVKMHLLDDQGNIRNFINIFVGEENIRSLDKENTNIQLDTVVSIVPAIAGGQA